MQLHDARQKNTPRLCVSRGEGTRGEGQGMSIQTRVILRMTACYKDQPSMTRKPYWRSKLHIRDRARQLRHIATDAETLLWQHLRLRSSTGLKWRRQHPIGPFIVDFYCAEHRFIVELDGSVHDEQIEHDAERTVLLEQAGYRMLRFRNEAVEADVQAVIDCINAWAQEQHG
jgi:very-short-patch-repair endonuclease